MRTPATCLLLLLAACAGPREPAKPERLVVASDLDNPPFAWVDDQGRPAGRDVEMMSDLARELEVELEWKRMPFDELLPAVEAGRVDVVCATLGATPERAQRVGFTRPYFRTRIVAVARTGAGEPDELAALTGRTLTAARGTTSERAVRRALPGTRLAAEVEDGRATGERLLSGEVDAAVMDEPAARALVAGAGGALAVLEPELTREDYVLAVARNREALRSTLDRALGRLADSGRLAELDRAHGLAP